MFPPNPDLQMKAPNSQMETPPIGVTLQTDEKLLPVIDDLTLLHLKPLS
jgi:hypothetical protein